MVGLPGQHTLLDQIQGTCFRAVSGDSVGVVSWPHKRLLRIGFLFRHLGRFRNDWAKFKARGPRTDVREPRPEGAGLRSHRTNTAADQTAKVGMEVLAYDKAGPSGCGQVPPATQSNLIYLFEFPGKPKPNHSTN